MRRKPVHRELAFKDALPDLIIGLVGIPVGFSLIEVASVMLPLKTEPVSEQLVKQQWTGFLCFVFIVLLYALHSVALYMLVEVGQRLTNRLPDSQRRVAWQRYLVLRILVSGPVTVFVVAMLTVVGVIFKVSGEPVQFGQSVQVLVWSLNLAKLIPLTFVGVGAVYAMVFTAAPLSKILDEYPLVVPYYTAVITTAFTGSLAVLFTFGT